ncbi:MAG: hypothetical protein JWO46_2459 [Nocardioidaceae bacterium]|nr:hypothetical protein [Nocardioidaceae bacterium]
MTMNDPGTIAPGTPSHDPDATSDGAKERAQQAAGTAAEEARNVAGTAADEARQVAAEAKSHVTGLVDQAVSQADDQAKTQRDRLVGVLDSLGDDLHNMSSRADAGLAADLTQEAAGRVQTLATHLDGREPRELLDDVRDFARRKPGVFLASALVAGVVVGRLTRGAREATTADGGSEKAAGSAPTPVHDTPAPTAPASTGFARPVPPASDLSPSSLPGTPQHPAPPLSTEPRS